MPTNYELPKKEQPAPEQSRLNPEITQEQITKAISEILFQRMSQSEVELMKAENAELKGILANFGKNYNKFEDLTKDLIRESKDEQLKLISVQNSAQEQKLTALRTSNEILSTKISSVVTGMKDNITRDITSLYEKIDKNSTERLKKYNEGINALEKQTKRILTVTGVKEALFWCVCLAILLFVGRATLDVYGVNLPVMVWQIAYPCSFSPLVGYAIKVIAEKIRG